MYLQVLPKTLNDIQQDRRVAYKENQRQSKQEQRSSNIATVKGVLWNEECVRVSLRISAGRACRHSTSQSVRGRHPFSLFLYSRYGVLSYKNTLDTLALLKQFFILSFLSRVHV